MERTGFTRTVFLDRKFQEPSASAPDFDKTKITQNGYKRADNYTCAIVFPRSPGAAWKNNLRKGKR